MTYIVLFRVSFCDSFLHTSEFWNLLISLGVVLELYPMHFICKLWWGFIRCVFQTVLQVSYFRHEKFLDLDYMRWPWVNLFREHADARSKNRHYITKCHGIPSKQCCWLVVLNRDLHKCMYMAFSMYISVGMLNCIQEEVLLMSQLTAQLCSQSLCHCTPSQLHNNAAALTSLLHHHHYIRSCQTSLSMLLRLMPNW